MAYSFGFSGSTPQTILPTSLSSGGTTSAAKALDSFASSTPTKIQSPTFPAIAPAPTSQPIKKQTVTTASGDTHTTEYHPPTSGMLSGSTSTPNSGGGSTLSAPGYVSTSETTPSTSNGLLTPTPTSTNTQTTSTQSPLAGIINSQVGIGQGKENPGLVDARNKLAQDTAEAAQVNSNLGTTPGMAQAEVQGRQANAANYYNTKLAADTQAVNNALTSQGQEIGALNNAGTLASPSNTNVTASPGSVTTNTLTGQQYSAPTQVPYSNQYIDPKTGQPIGGGTAGQLPQGAQDYINSLATQVKNGQMTRADAESRISTYSQPGLQALNAALGSDFNTNASNASADTTAIGQKISAAIPPANQALDALQMAFNGLSGLQQGNVPIINVNVPILGQLAQGVSMSLGIGRDAASAYQGALKEARSRIDAALVGSIGVDAAAAQANALLPDNMVSTEIPQKITAAKQYLQNQLSSYTQSGQQNNQSSNVNTNTQPAGWL